MIIFASLILPILFHLLYFNETRYMFNSMEFHYFWFFTIAALLVSYLITYEITCADFIGSICYLNVNLMVCDRATL